MNIYNNPLYQEDLRLITSFNSIPWDKLQNSSVLVSGATGMIGSLLIDSILFKNATDGLKCSVYALGRNEDKAIRRFGPIWGSPFFHFIQYDVNKPGMIPDSIHVDFILHLASNTHPVAYATDPVGTITANIIGTQNMLELAVSCGAKRFLFASSNEIYGENRGDVEFFNEAYCGYIDCNTLRAGYPESKRCGEALCQAYKKQKGIDIVIARLTRSFGPTLQLSDTKALSQFIKNGINKEDIVLKSTGEQFFSYTYSVDAVTGLLTILLRGESGEAYNVADESGDIRLRDLARLISEIAGTNVVFDIPNKTEAAGFSTATKARLDGEKLKKLGWSASMNLSDALIRTLDIVTSMESHKMS